MKRIFAISYLALTFFSGCKNYLDVNSDQDTPQFPDPASVLPAQLAGIPRGIQYDARYVGRYVQNWATASSGRTADVNWDNMGYVGASDANGDIWRQTYFGLGANLNYMIREGRTNGQWDYVGVAYALKAYMFQICTDYHGEIIFTDAFKENTALFKFDGQDTVYAGVRAFCDSALLYLARTDLNAANKPLSRGDYVYNGDRAKWIKFVYGILAYNYNHISNKTGLYDPAKVVEVCNKSMAVNTDDFLIPFDATRNDDTNFWGPYRDNLTFIRQTNFIVRLLDGTTIAGSSAAANRDPRMRHMLTASQDTSNGNGGYRGVNPGTGDPNYSSTNATTMRTRVTAPWGDSVYANPSANVFTPNGGKYLFRDKAVMPVMTAAEILFIKAEALYRQADYPGALDAYTKGINAHFDFINRTNMPRSGNTMFNGVPISATERSNYLNSLNVKKTAASLRLSDIMLQKYIALWGWGFLETWADLRRFAYGAETNPVALDPQTGEKVYLGFTLPTTIASTNAGMPVYRARPRYNSEYVWNKDELERIGANDPRYHTFAPWFVMK